MPLRPSECIPRLRQPRHPCPTGAYAEAKGGNLSSRAVNAAHLLGTVRRLVVSRANATVNRARKRNPKTKCNTRRLQQYFRSGTDGPKRLHSLLHSKSPFLPHS